MRFLTMLFCFLIASAAVAKDLKIASVDLQKAVTEYPAYKSDQKKLATLKDEKTSELVEEKRDLDRILQDIEKSKSVMSQEELKKKEDLYRKKGQELQDEQAQDESELANKQSLMLHAILGEVKDIVEKIAKDKGVDVVLDSQSVLYMRDELDLTDDVLKSYKNISSDSKDDAGSKK
jgi:outer membrane protein